jgi:hypothetical protein
MIVERGGVAVIHPAAAIVVKVLGQTQTQCGIGHRRISIRS